MLKYAALLAMSLTLLACDEPGSSLPDAGDVSFRPGGGGIRYSCTHLGSHNLEQLEHQGTTYTKVKHLDATTVMVVGEGASKVLKAYELIGDEMAIHGRFGEA
ncbi:MAG: hypothetical protein KC636_25025, partial [Myxococcales bacterium]|nr:hypothetical protein [Myxococcales bacterium]